jgi:hypothetical protein
VLATNLFLPASEELSVADKAELHDRLIGTWRLIETRATDAAGNPKKTVWGPEPMGRLVLTGNGRMMAVMCDGRVSMPEGNDRAYSSYCGNYRIEADTLITTVDAASERSRIGGEQRRRFRFDGDNLVLLPPREPDGEQREIFWVMNGVA